MVRAASYRVKQFWRALTAQVTEAELRGSLRALPPQARLLFRQQSVQDQRHALNVYYALREAGHTAPNLLAAALLHDLGKAQATLHLWQRTVVVLLGRFAPRRLAALTAPCEPGSWRWPFFVYAHHPELGARQAQEAGCSPRTVALIRRHEERVTDTHTTEDPWLAALQAADNRN
jgi:hypothetical protein